MYVWSFYAGYSIENASLEADKISKENSLFAVYPAHACTPVYDAQI